MPDGCCWCWWRARVDDARCVFEIFAIRGQGFAAWCKGAWRDDWRHRVVCHPSPLVLFAHCHVGSPFDGRCCSPSDFETLKSGLQYKDGKIGSGTAATDGCRVVMDWEGYTIGEFVVCPSHARVQAPV